MAVKRTLLGMLSLAALSAACGGSASAPLDDGADRDAPPDSSLNPLLPGPVADDAEAAAQTDEGTSDEPRTCDPAACPELELFGVLTPGCCRFGELCGGRVQVSERTWACLGPEVEQQGEELRSALTLAAREPFKPDGSCPSHVIDGDELPGCCRGGVCGVDTQLWTRSAAFFGLTLPRACLDPREAAELAEQPASSAPPPPCDQ